MDNNIINLGLYTFSALIQADAAIFGIFAVFMVYRLQTMDSYFQSSFNIASSIDSPVKDDVKRLLLPIPEAEVQRIMFDHRSTIYLSHLLTVATTGYQKKTTTRSSIPVFIFLIVHVALSSIGLFYSGNSSNILCLDPTQRIVFSLILFVLLLSYIARSGYKSFSIISKKWKLSPPEISLESFTDSNMNPLFPNRTGISYLYALKESKLKRLIRLRLGDRGKLEISLLGITDDGGYITSPSVGQFEKDKLSEVLDAIKKNPDNYWKHKI
jgi:hypothetical protein